MERLRKDFIKTTRKIGNSSGVLLPKSLLGAEVKVTVLSMPRNPKRDIMKYLEPILEEILGVYIIGKKEKTTEVIAISTRVRKVLERENYKIDIVPLKTFKKAIKEKKQITKDFLNAQVILNKKLFSELKELIS